eukprot:CAMPEP_0117648148 /NCGR_PEP_ID=MMETSP0804-20121206/235_1 /TAXON_ID=1074897 /ORGANISM="Tetraselmis astigmatica, Strain CCMP880" /LENGTH=279 /DNA_ID=CAMNT_0005453701 /DNA_START=784 /DNA_END=1621 /DNA_ORIENTATION=+
MESRTREAKSPSTYAPSGSTNVVHSAFRSLLDRVPRCLSKRLDDSASCCMAAEAAALRKAIIEYGTSSQGTCQDVNELIAGELGILVTKPIDKRHEVHVPEGGQLLQWEVHPAGASAHGCYACFVQGCLLLTGRQVQPVSISGNPLSPHLPLDAIVQQQLQPCEKKAQDQRVALLRAVSELGVARGDKGSKCLVPACCHHLTVTEVNGGPANGSLAWHEPSTVRNWFGAIPIPPVPSKLPELLLSSREYAVVWHSAQVACPNRAGCGLPATPLLVMPFL